MATRRKLINGRMYMRVYASKLLSNSPGILAVANLIIQQYSNK